jgi:hypothetical protein
MKGDSIMLLLQIAFASAAWRRGWGAKSLLPFAAGYGIIFAAGFVGGLSGLRSAEPLKPLAVIIEVGILGALVVMSVRPRKAAAPSVPSEAETESCVSSRAA